MSTDEKDKLQIDAAKRDRTKLYLEWAKTGIGLVSLLSIGLAYTTYWQYHDRASKDRAITLLQDLAKNMTPATRAAQKLQMSFCDEQLKKLKEGEPFTIAMDKVPLLEAALGYEINTKKPSWESAFGIGESGYKLTARESFILRWQIASYLNAIEVICQAEGSAVADSKIIMTELRGLYSKQTGMFCRKYREFIDGINGGWEIYPENDRSAPHYPEINRVAKALDNQGK